MGVGNTRTVPPRHVLCVYRSTCLKLWTWSQCGIHHDPVRRWPKLGPGAQFPRLLPGTRISLPIDGIVACGFRALTGPLTQRRLDVQLARIRTRQSSCGTTTLTYVAGPADNAFSSTLRGTGSRTFRCLYRHEIGIFGSDSAAMRPPWSTPSLTRG